MNSQRKKTIDEHLEDIRWCMTALRNTLEAITDTEPSYDDLGYMEGVTQMLLHHVHEIQKIKHRRNHDGDQKGQG